MSATILPPAARPLPTPNDDTPPGASNLPQANKEAAPEIRAPAATNVRPTSPVPTPICGALAADLVKDLRLAAEKLDAIESARIPLGQLAGDYESKGVLDLEFLAYLRGVEDTLKLEEHQATLQLVRVLRRHPLYPFIKGTVGLGDKQTARFLASLGNADPGRNERDDRPRRGPAELWAYCGFSPDQKRRKGERSNWNPTAKMRMRLIAESCVKQMHSPYRAVYDEARASWADRDTTDLHKHNHALRVVAKTILRDLWIEAQRLRGDHDAGGTQTPSVPADLPSATERAMPILGAPGADLEAAS